MTKSKYNFAEVSMKIILHAGDARTKTDDAFNAVVEGNFDLAYSLLSEANECIKKAHQVQTDLLQSLAMDEYNGDAESQIIPMLLIHAQDTIMTIMSEVSLTKRMILLYEKNCKEKK